MKALDQASPAPHGFWRCRPTRPHVGMVSTESAMQVRVKKVGEHTALVGTQSLVAEADAARPAAGALPP